MADIPNLPKSLAPMPPPSNPLGYHRILSPTSGARVSPLALGTMTFGEAWYEALESAY